MRKNKLFQRRFLWRISFLLLLIYVFSGCGQNITSKKRPIGHISNSTLINVVVNSPMGSADQPAYSRKPEHSTVNNLQVVIDVPDCTLNQDFQQRYYFPNLVLTTNKLSYDIGTAQKIAAYLVLVYKHMYDLGTWIPPQPPKELQWLPGGYNCTSSIQITNVSNANIEIDNIGITLTKPVAPNSNKYNMVNYSTSCVHTLNGGCGAAPGCGYNANVVLNDGNIGTLLSNPIAIATDGMGNPCTSPIVLQPGSAQDIPITFTDAQHRSVNYAGNITLGVTTSTGAQNIVFPDLPLIINLINTNNTNLPCYYFEENRFALLGAPAPKCFVYP